MQLLFQYKLENIFSLHGRIKFLYRAMLKSRSNYCNAKLNQSLKLFILLLSLYKFISIGEEYHKCSLVERLESIQIEHYFE